MTATFEARTRIEIPRVDVLGVPVDALHMADAVAFAERAIDGATQPVCVLAVNPEKVFSLMKDRRLLEFFLGVDLLIPDGIGIVWAAKMLNAEPISRVPGADLMPELCALAERKGRRVFLFGARESVNAAAARNLLKAFPRLRIAGRKHGYIGEEDAEELVAEINRSRADILFVALGSPRQEKWIAEHRHKLKVKVIQGVGGTFDVVAGLVQRAPKAWQRAHVEWLYRLVREPRRIRRQVAVLPIFVWKVLRLRYLGSTAP